MQFIEQLFGFSPDGGTGLTEIMIVILVFTAGLLILLRSRGRERIRRRRLQR